MKTVPLTCAGCDKKMHRTTLSAPQGHARCRECRKNVVNYNHGTATSYKKGCRCRPCKDARNAEARAYNARRKERTGSTADAANRRKRRGVPAEPPSCFLCKKPMNRVTGKGVRYPLHKKCRDLAPNWVRKNLDNPRRSRFQAKIDKIAEGTSGGGRVWTSGACDWCGDIFVGVGFTCSDKCRSARKFSKGSEWSNAKSPASRKRIYERDAWTCQICLRPVDISGGPGSALYPSLDHIVPQSSMLVPDHSAGNLRTVHMICNSYRRDDAVPDRDVREIVMNLYPMLT